MMRKNRRWIAQLTGFGFLLPAFLMVQCQQSSTSNTGAFEIPAPAQSNDYPLGPDSRPQAFISAGETIRFDLKDSKVFPGTTRTITVYVPAAYKGDKPACVYVGLDSLAFNVTTVFDNLIAQHAMPVTIAIGVTAGFVPSAKAQDNPRFDRSFEFDAMNDRVARLLIEEVLPAVEQRHTSDGRRILLSTNPDDRAIGGGSTAGIGSFTVAWERPDAFRRVFSAIGTYVGMRGGEQYYVLVRKTEPKPIRIYMQDGANDEWGGGPEMGDWWMSNLTMERALKFAGYDVRHTWGTGTHNGNQATAVFPDAMRWLWRDWPAPLRSGESENPVLKDILQPNAGWQVAATGCSDGVSLASNTQGQAFYPSGESQGIAPVSFGDKPIRCSEAKQPMPFAFGPDDRLFLARPGGGIRIMRSQNERGAGAVLGEGLHVQGLTVRSTGDVYITAQTGDGHSELWLLRSNGGKLKLDGDLKGASGIALSPDGLWLFVGQSLSRSGLSYRVKPDGTVDDREPFYEFYVPAWADDSGAAEIAIDHDGRAYVATRMGVQVFDRNGRVAAILPLPNNQPATGICFGGSGFDTLFVASNKVIYARKLRVAGSPSWAAPVKLPAGNSG